MSGEIPMGPSLRSRRGALAVVGGGLLAAGLGPAAAAARRDRRFKVYRNDVVIGSHTVRFGAAEGGMRVASRLDLAVKVAFVTLFRYRQAAEDLWRGGVLVQSRIETDDDGRKTQVLVERRDGKLAVEGRHGGYGVELGTMTDLCFWHEGITRQRHLIDSKDGELTRIATGPGVEETIRAGGVSIAARRFTIRVSEKRSGTIWYDAAGDWVKARLNTRGETLDYELVG